MARQDKEGALISLEHQNRAKWDQVRIREGTDLLQTAMARGQIGPYQLQAAISALHGEAKSWANTDWPQIEALYRVLVSIQPSPVVHLNLAIALSYARSSEVALEYLDEFLSETDLSQYQPFFAAKADLYHRAGDIEKARAHYETAITLASGQAQKDFLNQKMSTLAR